MLLLGLILSPIVFVPLALLFKAAMGVFEKGNHYPLSIFCFLILCMFLYGFYDMIKEETFFTPKNIGVMAGSIIIYIYYKKDD